MLCNTGSASPLIQLVPWFLIIGIFYFLLILPQQKEQKKKESDHKSMLEGLSKNDEVVTIGGIHGTVVNVKEKTIVIRVDDNAKIEVDKSAIASKVK